VKILHLVSSSGYYGKEAVVINLCSALEKLGCASEVGAFLNSQAPNQDLVDRAHVQGLQATTFACNGRLDLGAVRAIRDHILSQQVDLIHTHDYKADLYGYLAARRAARPVFATCHLWFSTTMQDRFYGGIDRLVLRGFDGVIGVSPPIVGALMRAWVPERKMAVIANGIDFSPFLSVEDALAGREFGPNPTIGIVGRLVRQKGHQFLFAATHGILKQFPKVRFVLIGEGPDGKQLEAQALKLGISDKVHFAGFRTDMPRVYSSIDLMVMPSLDEGLPMALLEAMAAKRAVIASAVGSVPEVIEHGQSGLLVKPGDAVDLEQAILLLLNDASLRNRIAENARQSVLARFSSDLMARNYLDFYERMGHLPVGNVVTA
jgi:glycosyltransferase involved in cell wall biosynthesis